MILVSIFDHEIFSNEMADRQTELGT